MVKALINNELYLSYPDGFKEISREGLQEIFLDDNPNRWGVKDENRNMLITVLWHKTNMISAMMVSPRTIAISTEHKMKTSLYNSNYVFHDYMPKKVSGRNAYGFSYEYILEDVEQIGEVLVTQNVNRYYTVYFYALKKNKQKARTLIDAVTKSLRFSNDK